jgi:hypothetical protein
MYNDSMTEPNTTPEALALWEQRTAEYVATHQ